MAFYNLFTFRSGRRIVLVLFSFLLGLEREVAQGGRPLHFRSYTFPLIGLIGYSIGRCSGTSCSL